MANKGFSHVGLATRDLEKTKEFYESVLGFTTQLIDVIDVEEGGQIRHLIMDAGRDQVIAFMEPRGVPGIPAEYDAGINRGLGLPSASIMLPSKPVAKAHSNRSEENSFVTVFTLRRSSITISRSRSTSRIRMASSSSSAVPRVI
jgi:catechol 2,3-dioxygenase-like lactoylglutathione lyase family enzyme